MRINIIALCVAVLSLTSLTHANVNRSSLESFHNHHSDGYHGIAFIIGPEIQDANSKMVYSLGMYSAIQQTSSKYSNANDTDADGNPIFSNESTPVERPTFYLSDKKLMGYLSDNSSTVTFEQTAISF